jgi:dihydrofolate reductase
VEIILIAAISENYVIGKENNLIWHLPKDLKRFKKITSGFPVIMGRKTFDSIGEKPLPKRQNIIISSQNVIHENDSVFFVKNLEKAIEKAKTFGKEKVYIIGGGQLYKNAIDVVDRLDITKVHQNFSGNVFFPEINPEKWKLESEEKHYSDENHACAFSFCAYKRI